MTWEPPWGYDDITVIAHEMGHGFGLPHSSGQLRPDLRQPVGRDERHLDELRSRRDATYGCLGQHTIAYHKDLLGWIPANQKLVVTRRQPVHGHGRRPRPGHDRNYRMAEIPVVVGLRLLDRRGAPAHRALRRSPARRRGDHPPVDQGGVNRRWCYDTKAGRVRQRGRCGGWARPSRTPSTASASPLILPLLPALW